MAAPKPQAFAPLQGSERVIGTLALSLATFMNVLDTSIANVSLPAICGQPRRQPDPGDLGDHLVRRGERDRGAA